MLAVVMLQWVLGLLLCTVQASPTGTEQRDPNTYDYVIVGGGLSGLVVANRLSEDPNGM